MARNLLVPDIDTSGIRSADIQARQVHALGQRSRNIGLRNVLLERQIERLPELEARETETYELEKDQKELDMLKTQIAVVRDFMPQVTKDSYDDFFDWMNEMGLPSDKLMKSVDEVQKMSDKDFEDYMLDSMRNADDVIQMDLEEYKADKASELQRQKDEAAMGRKLAEGTEKGIKPAETNAIRKVLVAELDAVFNPDGSYRLGASKEDINKAEELQAIAEQFFMANRKLGYAGAVRLARKRYKEFKEQQTETVPTPEGKAEAYIKERMEKLKKKPKSFRGKGYTGTF